MALKSKYEIGDIVTVCFPEDRRISENWGTLNNEIDFIIMGVDCSDKDTVKYLGERLHPKNDEQNTCVIDESYIERFARIDFNDIQSRVTGLLKAYCKSEGASILDLNITLDKDKYKYTVSLEYNESAYFDRQTIVGEC